MTFERDFYEERRRKWRRSAFWRGFFLAVLLFVIVFTLAIFLPNGYPSGPQIARFEIYDVIYEDPERERLLSELAYNEDVAAVLLRIDSPGGTTVGAETIFANIRTISERKPVVVVMGEVAASGGYIAAIAGDYLIARGNTLTGSIGVIMEYPDVTGLMETVGVQMQTVRSSDVKGGSSPFRSATAAETAENEVLVNDAFQWFRGLVAERRNLDGADLDAVTTGGAFSGRQALQLGLIDAIGGEVEALGYLESLHPDFATLPVETWILETNAPIWTEFLASKVGITSLLSEIYPRQGQRLYSLAR